MKYTIYYQHPVRLCTCDFCPEQPNFKIEYDFSESLITIYSGDDQWSYLFNKEGICPKDNPFIEDIVPLIELIQSTLKRLIVMKNFL